MQTLFELMQHVIGLLPQYCSYNPSVVVVKMWRSGGILWNFMLPFTRWVLNEVLNWYWYHFKGTWIDTGIVIFLTIPRPSSDINYIILNENYQSHYLHYQSLNTFWLPNPVYGTRLKVLIFPNECLKSLKTGHKHIASILFTVSM